jgi:multiple antibiotic resistance protein
MSGLRDFRDTFLQIFFVFTPFSVLSVFLAMTRELTESERTRIALRTILAVGVVSVALLLVGRGLFFAFGITLDAFRIGAGALLFLNALSLLRGEPITRPGEAPGELAVVPLAVPITVGPACTGVLLILGAESSDLLDKFTVLAAVLSATAALGLLLRLGAVIERKLGEPGLSILSKLTALMLASLAAQMVVTGFRNLLVGAPS